MFALKVPRHVAHNCCRYDYDFVSGSQALLPQRNEDRISTGRTPLRHGACDLPVDLRQQSFHAGLPGYDQRGEASSNKRFCAV